MMRVPSRVLSVASGWLSVALLLTGCSALSEGEGRGADGADPTPAPSVAAPARQDSGKAGPSTGPSPSAAATTSPRTGPEPSDGTPVRATLSIPRIGLQDLVVVPYRGRPDDGPGTEIQDGGVAASPHGPRGGTGAGGVGNYIVTAHRTSSTRAFWALPSLRKGDRVTVEAAGVRYVYEITGTRSTSFRSAASLRRQAAAVPGHPGREPTRAVITLSTCATPEDHAAGNYWSDEFGNPEHRIDKIGVLVRAVPVAPAP